MKFFNMAPGQKLILIKTTVETPPACPVLAKRAPVVVPFWQVIALWLCTWLKPLLKSLSDIGDKGRMIRTSIRPNLAFLTFLFWMLVEVLAQDYLERIMVGV